MLPRANRGLRQGDFRAATRHGERAATDHTIVYLFDRGDSAPTRFGFIVGKTVGNAVTRNRVRRRLQAVGRELLGRRTTGANVVMRALPGIADVAWTNLHRDITATIERRP